MDNFIKQRPNSQEGWRLYSVEELRKMPAITIFNHQTLGRVWLEYKNSSKKDKNILSADGQIFSLEDGSDFPFNVPMQEEILEDFE